MVDNREIQSVSYAVRALDADETTDSKRWSTLKNASASDAKARLHACSSTSIPIYISNRHSQLQHCMYMPAVQV